MRRSGCIGDSVVISASRRPGLGGAPFTQQQRHLAAHPEVRVHDQFRELLLPIPDAPAGVRQHAFRDPEGPFPHPRVPVAQRRGQLVVVEQAKLFQGFQGLQSDARIRGLADEGFDVTAGPGGSVLEQQSLRGVPTPAVGGLRLAGDLGVRHPGEIGNRRQGRVARADTVDPTAVGTGAVGLRQATCQGGRQRPRLPGVQQ